MPDLPDLPRTEAAIIEMTNAFRTSEKLAPVVPNAALTRTARLFAEYLARTGTFAHEADGREPADRASASGYRYCTVAENLALNLDSRGFTTERLAREAVEGWKTSPGHRRNMLLPEVTETGVGIARATRERDPKFLSVQLFGRPEALKKRIRVENHSGTAVTYTLGGKSQTVEARVTITQSTCTAERIRFDRAGSWLGGQKLDAMFTLRDGATFVVRGDGGRVAVEMR